MTFSAAGFKEQGSGEKLAVQTPFWLCDLFARKLYNSKPR